MPNFIVVVGCCYFVFGFACLLFFWGGGVSTVINVEIFCPYFISVEIFCPYSN